MTARFESTNLDLSRLPAPEVVKGVDFETILSERLARFKELWPAFDMGGIETDPAVILQQVDAYREVLDLAAINDAARSVLLAFATGSNLDNLAAFYGVIRLVIQPADPLAGTPAVMESDSDLRRRVQLAPEALPYAGMTGGGYRSLALKTAPSLKDASPVKRSAGRVDVVLLGRDGDGSVPSDVVNSVYRVFQDDEATQLTDIVSVRSAEIVPYAVNMKLRIRPGPDPSLVKASAATAITAYTLGRHRVGLPVYGQMIEAVASIGGVELADAVDFVDIKPALDQAAFCTGITITHEIGE